jgi:hypothetical protein
MTSRRAITDTARAAAQAAWLVAATLLAVGCGAGESPSVATSPLPPGALARAGSELVQSHTVARIAAAQGVSPRAALALAISDALFAQAALVELPVASKISLKRAADARSYCKKPRARGLPPRPSSPRSCRSAGSTSIVPTPYARRTPWF